jgi:hypothetical protein
MTIPERIDIIRPLIIYMSAIFHPNKPRSNTRATSLIIGEAIRKENVVPSGTPAWTKPKNNGIAEQEQKGVIIPSSEAKTLPTYLFLRESIALIFSGGRYDRIIDTTNIITDRRINILIVSKMKKFTEPASKVLGVIPRTL